MIIRIVKLTLNPAMISRFYEDYNLVKDQIRAFEGCLYSELLEDISGNGILFTYTLWETPGHLENYRNSELFKSTWARVKPMFSSRAEAWTVERKDALK